MTRSYIIAAKRTAVVPANGAFATLPFHTLAAPVIQHCLNSAYLDPIQVDELIVGNALGAGGNPARLCALAANLPETVAGLTIDRQCVSGLDAILLADAMIRAGQADVILAGGVESTSRRPLRAQTFPDDRPPKPYTQAPFTPWPDRDPNMHIAANTLAENLNITRAACDTWACRSHAMARAARDQLTAEITPLAGVTTDPFTRNLTPALCNRARPIAGRITPANTAVAADGAAFCLVVSERFAKNHPATAILGGRTIGGTPDLPGLAPVAAINHTLHAAQITPTALTTAEIMEAYAAQAIACVQGSHLNPDIVNLGGGALARGHPIGASGAINAVRLHHELINRGGTGIAAIAAAGGIGTALLLSA